MRRVSNVLGRIILIAVGILIIAAAVMEIIASVAAMNQYGWFNFFSPESRAATILFLLAIVDIIIGLTAFGCGIRGRRTFGLFFFTLVLLVSPIYTIVVRAQAGELVANWETVGKLILEFLTPVLYFTGFLLLARVRD